MTEQKVKWIKWGNTWKAVEELGWTETQWEFYNNNGDYDTKYQGKRPE
jgi:hypothetical protein